jgi:predicted GNAT superfamily acetyltransferase
LRHVTIADLRSILAELDEFWEERDTAFLHQALYVHEFGESSVLAERDGRITGYLLGFVGQEEIGYVHAVAVRREARGEGLARRMYERFEELVAARGAYRLKAITSPENAGSRAFHEALGFSVEEVDDYSPSGGARLVFGKVLGERVAGSGREVDLGDGVWMRPLQLEDTEELHKAIEANRAQIGRWLRRMSGGRCAPSRQAGASAWSYLIAAG